MHDWRLGKRLGPKHMVYSVQRLRAVTDNSTDMFWRWQVACDGYPEDLQHILTQCVGQWLRRCYCCSPSGILKYDICAFQHIQRQVVRCRPCCYLVHFLLARVSVDWWDDKILVVCKLHQQVAGMQWFEVGGCDSERCRPNARPLDNAGWNARRWWLFPVEHSAVSMFTEKVNYPVVDGDGKFQSRRFANRVECRTVSKTLLKSSDITMTNGLDCRRVVMVWRSDMTAAEVESVGRNAYWSKNVSDGIPPEEIGAKNSILLVVFSKTSRFNDKYLLKERDVGNRERFGNCKRSPTWSQNCVNFKPQTPNNRTEDFNHTP